MYRTVIKGVGGYLPERKLTNEDLVKMVDTSEEWIVTRTGILERPIAKEGQGTSDLAYEAAKIAIEDAGLNPSDMDYIIVATTTPDYIFPSVATIVQEKLGCRTIGAVDVNATCSGFIYALELADSMIKAGKYKNILVIGADKLSSLVDYQDRGTCILFSDGAGAFVLSRSSDLQQKGIIHTSMHTEGTHRKYLWVPHGGSQSRSVSEETKARIEMDGKRIFKLAVQSMVQTMKDTLEQAGYQKEDIDWVIPHQANQRIIDSVAEQMEVPKERVISTIKHYANNSSATIPLAFHSSLREGKISKGDLIMLTAFGGGLVWGSVLLEY